ncbi:PepSY domain-containing protein (plasmid) [Ralstonia solanacearum]|uniref:PepSY-associated TM helix domain-containing protein n=1 Tax=Ralstonia solanacearum TaxID=305 RepID=UPI0006DD02E3|nr:PepSY domain-containing protein [Ralstonia solanacearum]QHB56472.1 PepSY domain-containing protein [Ralstonia solanacearum]
MKSATLRLYQTLHTWVGLMAGWALFIAFFAGAITVFHDELRAWQDPRRSQPAVTVPADGAAIDRFVSALVRAHPAAAAYVRVNLPTRHAPDFTAYWQEQGTWHATTGAKLAAGRTAPADIAFEPTRGQLANFINDLHYALGFSDIGIYFMGAVSVLYGLALVSGVLLHLPRMKKDLLAVRHGRNLKRFWMDMHNVLGLFSLPFHLIFAMTAPLLCLGMVLATLFNTLAFDGKLLDAMPRIMTAADTVAAAGRPAPLLPATQLLAAARAAAGPGFTPTSIRFQHIGDAHAVAEWRGSSARALGDYGWLAVRAAAGQADSGRLLGNQTADARDANHAVFSVVYGLHFATYGDVALRLAYFVMGVAGAFVFYSGNLLWIESRRKQRKPTQPRVHRRLAQATVGICIGCCAGVMAMFPAALLWPERAVTLTYYPVFLGALAWALLRPPARGAVELLGAAAGFALLAPITNAIVTGNHLLRTVMNGQWNIAGFDLGALALACGFIALARATWRRARHGTPDSVWALPPQTTRQSCQPGPDTVGQA